MRDETRISFALSLLADGERTLPKRATEHAFHHGHQGRQPLPVELNSLDSRHMFYALSRSAQVFLPLAVVVINVAITAHRDHCTDTSSSGAEMIRQTWRLNRKAHNGEKMRRSLHLEACKSPYSNTYLFTRPNIPEEACSDFAHSNASYARYRWKRALS